MRTKNLAFDEAISNMSMDKSPYFQDYVFYMHLIAQCRVVMDTRLPAVAGVRFNKDHYVITINPENIHGKDEEGNDVTITGFNMEMPLEKRIGVLKHEMLHIAYNHLDRFKSHTGIEIPPDGKLSKEDASKFKGFNIAADCALDQDINREHLPDYCIYPDNYPNPKANDHWKESAEFYYNLLTAEDMEKIAESMDGDLLPGEGTGDSGSGYLVDDHSGWLTSEGDPTFQEEITKNMVERAGTETMKSRGNLPSNYSDLIENLTIRREVQWKQVLRRIVGNKKANKRKTLMRKDRRLPNFNWIKGVVKNRVFHLGVISDVSGSVSDQALYSLWGEAISICDMFKVPITLVQVDTRPSDPEELTRSTRTIERKACGGTVLSPAIAKFEEKNCKVDALLITTDGYLSSEDVNQFAAVKKPVIWLNGADDIVAHVESKLGIKLGETTADDRITLVVEEECLAGCCGAPMMVVDGHYHEHLDTDKVDKILDGLD